MTEYVDGCTAEKILFSKDVFAYMKQGVSSIETATKNRMLFAVATTLICLCARSTTDSLWEGPDLKCQSGLPVWVFF